MKKTLAFFLCLVSLLTAGLLLPQTVSFAATSSKTLSSGFRTENGKTYYIKKDGSRAKGLVTVGGKKYYFDKDGVQQTGWQTVNGTDYYFLTSPDAHGRMYGRWYKGPTKWYFILANGTKLTGLKNIDGKKYLFSDSGIQKTGTQTVNGRRYLFNAKDGKNGYLLGYWSLKDSHYRFIGTDGKRVTGLMKANGKTYYFDKNGVQHTGWQKIGDNYYFFNIRTREKGYMIKDKTLNGVKLSSSGKAVLTDASRAKLNVLIKANKLYEKITVPTDAKNKRLHACFDYIRDDTGYCTPRTFKPISHWEYAYALDIFNNNKGNCFSYGSAFAFLAVCCGYDNVNAVTSGGHGWAEIDGLVYDPDWAIVSRVDTYFAMPYSRSGVNGRPNYKKYRAYVAPI